MTITSTDTEAASRMRRVFADSLYWIARSHERYPFRSLLATHGEWERRPFNRSVVALPTGGRAAKRAGSLQRRQRLAQAFVLGDSLPESGAVLPGEWRVAVAATCPACVGHLVASAGFEGRVLLEFALVADA
jgi:hypothetical protein